MISPELKLYLKKVFQNKYVLDRENLTSINFKKSCKANSKDWCVLPPLTSANYRILQWGENDRINVQKPIIDSTINSQKDNNQKLKLDDKYAKEWAEELNADATKRVGEKFRVLQPNCVLNVSDKSISQNDSRGIKYIRRVCKLAGSPVMPLNNPNFMDHIKDRLQNNYMKNETDNQSYTNSVTNFYFHLMTLPEITTNHKNKAEKPSISKSQHETKSETINKLNSKTSTSLETTNSKVITPDKFDETANLQLVTNVFSNSDDTISISTSETCSSLDENIIKSTPKEYKNNISNFIIKVKEETPIFPLQNKQLIEDKPENNALDENISSLFKLETKVYTAMPKEQPIEEIQMTEKEIIQKLFLNFSLDHESNDYLHKKNTPIVSPESWTNYKINKMSVLYNMAGKLFDQHDYSNNQLQPVKLKRK